MFGSEFSKNPEILLSSFGEMQGKYKKIAKKNKNTLTSRLQKLYIQLLGIPEVGFQIRSMHFQKTIEDKLEKKKFKKILDAGSGIGIYSFWLARKFPEANVYGGEIANDKLKFSSEFGEKIGLSNIKFNYFDVTKKVNGKPNYDLIVNIDVLEHIDNYKQVIKNFHKLLRTAGFLYIHTPQPHQKRIFKSLKKWAHEDHIHEGYTPDDLVLELKKNGFKIISKKETFGFFGKLAWELNHISLKKGFVVSGILYPFLFAISLLDLAYENSEGLGTSILAQKVK